MTVAPHQVDFSQRWRARRESYRPAGEVIATQDYNVALMPHDAEAKDFVVAHHYSGTYPAARWRAGLYRRGALVGVAVFSHPCSDAVLTSVFAGEATDSVELGRFVLLDEVPANGETWFLGRAFQLLRREGLRGVVSFADPLPRRAADGTVTTPGHVGTIYQAFNGVYLGRATPRTLHLLPDGSTFSDRAASKVRRGERGWRYAVAQLVAAGAPPPPEGTQALSGWQPQVRVGPAAGQGSPAVQSPIPTSGWLMAGRHEVAADASLSPRGSPAALKPSGGDGSRQARSPPGASAAPPCPSEDGASPPFIRRHEWHAQRLAVPPPRRELPRGGSRCMAVGTLSNSTSSPSTRRLSKSPMTPRPSSSPSTLALLMGC